MSLGEIKNLIKEKGLKPTHLKDSMVKQITWDDQWMGYDVGETWAEKKAWADGQCCGGTMVWSIDFQAGDSGGNVPALPVEEGRPGKIPKKLMDKKLPDCKWGISFDNIKDKGKFWYDSGAEQWADEYINSQKDHSNWASNLFRELFPDDDHTEFDCQTPGASCNHGLKCGRTLVSIRVHVYLSQIGTMRQLLNIKSGAPAAPLDVADMLGAAFSIGSALATPVPILGGPLAAISGAWGGSDDVVEATDTIRGLLAGVAADGFENIKKILIAVSGKQGHRQTDIPELMRVGGVSNPALQVFG
ncbi:hypothetical protein FZEAL_1444 [Fusarium zealandicum]|uniref:Chitinase n=1 Tax=Fusarium zealandicum TaxID=1053134 RepID=A0A8H4UTE8_9HYPO|nr:hypothetical protein FZEAL_1444 [Fusarium zealandicum]